MRMLGLSWNSKVDSFSLGCVVAEVWKGSALFPVTTRLSERLRALRTTMAIGTRFLDVYHAGDMVGPIRPWIIHCISLLTRMRMFDVKMLYIASG